MKPHAIAAASIKESQERHENRRRQYRQQTYIIKTKNLNRVLKRVNAMTKYSRSW